jgi:hypothetical protein
MLSLFDRLVAGGSRGYFRGAFWLACAPIGVKLFSPLLVQSLQLLMLELAP